jgi:hypothetical protein
MLNDFISSSSFDLSNHQWLSGQRDDHCTREPKGTGGMNSSKTCITTGRRENVWFIIGAGKFFKTTENVIANASARS